MPPIARPHPSIRRDAYVAVASLLALTALALLAGCGAAAKPRAQRVSVSVATAAERPMPIALSATGTVEPIETAAVGSQVGGVVTRIAFREGDDVRAGQVLFQLDPRPFRAVLEQTLAALAKDRAQAEAARLEAERSLSLFQQHLLSQAEWDQNRTASESWSASVRVDSAAASLARLNLDYASIRAPIAGRTGRLMVHVGDLMKSATSEPLVTINQVHSVRVRFTVPVGDVPRVQRYRGGRPRVIVRIPDADSTAYEGALVFVDNAVDPSSGTLTLKGEFANRDGALVPGQFVDVRLVLDVEPRAVVVPAQAVSRGQEGAFVYVLGPDSTVAPRPVVVDRTIDEMAVVASGVAPGEIVITDGQMRLSPGAKVVVRRPEKAAP